MGRRPAQVLRSIGALVRAALRDVHDSMNVEMATVRRSGNRTFIVRAEDRAAGARMRAIIEERRRIQLTGGSVPRLMSFRPEFRCVIGRGRICALFRCLDAYDPELTRLAIWLMSRMHRRDAIPEINPFGSHVNVRLRREVARGLFRLGAWAELRAIAQHDPDPRVQRLVVGLPVDSFENKFARFARSQDSDRTPPLGVSTPTWLLREPVGGSRPPKAPELIRAILERIRKLVRGL